MSAVGLYGVTAYGITVRRREFGIRMALGAGRRNILWMVFRQGLLRTGIGVLVGLLLAAGLSRVLESILYEVAPGDPVTFFAVAVILGAIAMFACLVPASRAVRIDPGASLRQT
jgi:ABC-type antimicrobial peptide transport system permease subunit